MANNNSGPSAKLLWFIVPVAVALSIHLTTHEHPMPRPYLNGDITEARVKQPVKPATPAASDTTKADTLHTVPQDAGEMHSPEQQH